MSQYVPDRWVMLEINYGEETIRKVFAGWYGGYANGDSWKLSSGVVSTKEEDTKYIFDNYSGSEYICHKNAEGMSGYMAQILSGWLSHAEENGGNPSIKIIPYDERDGENDVNGKEAV